MDLIPFNDFGFSLFPFNQYLISVNPRDHKAFDAWKVISIVGETIVNGLY